MYSDIKVCQKYLVTSIKVGCATRSLYASSGPKAEGVATNNQRGWGMIRNFKLKLEEKHMESLYCSIIINTERK